MSLALIVLQVIVGIWATVLSTFGSMGATACTGQESCAVLTTLAFWAPPLGSAVIVAACLIALVVGTVTRRSVWKICLAGLIAITAIGIAAQVWVLGR